MTEEGTRSRPRRVTLGVTGSIAAYKAAEIIRLLTKAGVEVECILTRHGAEFITPVTLATLSGRPVTTEMFPAGNTGPDPAWGLSAPTGGTEQADGPGTAASPTASPAGAIRHIQASRESDLIIVAPATGNILGKVAAGIADDALSTAIMASSVPVLFAPAMNTRMWESAAVQANVKLLRERGFLFVWPGTGDLACGEMGTGRMADPDEIVAAVQNRLGAEGRGLALLVTAGRTEEDLDPVRSVTNRSSGRMGYAVAEAARDRGYRVTLVSGVTSLSPPKGVTVVWVRSAAEMAREVQSLHADHQVLVMAAAVADYRAARPAPGKIPGRQPKLVLDLVPTEDILASLRGRRSGRVTVGFALETARELAAARRKLEAKGVDLLVLNNPTRPGSEFGGLTNEVTFLSRDGSVEALPVLPKYEVARRILERAEGLLRSMTRGGDRTAGDERRVRVRRSRT